MAKKSIQEFYAYFVDNLQADATLHYLRNRKWLTPDEYDTLKSGQMSRRQKAEKLLLLLPRKVTSSYDGEKILVDCIIWSGQGDLVKNLGYSDNEISVIKGKNPSGTSPVPDTPGHGYADAGVHTWYNGQGYAGQPAHMGHGNHGVNNMGFTSQGYHHTHVGYGQSQYTGGGGAVGSQYGGATGYGGNERRVEVGPSVIIYARDDDPDDAIEVLAGLLRSNGVDCDIDQYHTNDKISNWDQWWEQKVRGIAEQNGFILLVCSPTMMQCLSNNERILMKEGSISCLLLSSLIENRRTTTHLIPVFLDDFIPDYLPLSLTQRKWYALMLHTLANSFDVENIRSDEFVNLQEFDSVASLWRKLTGQPEVERPPVAQIPRIPRPVKANAPIQESLEQTGPPPDMVTADDIPMLINRIRTKNKSWSKLAVRLKVPSKKISDIRNANHDRDQACSAVLQTWLAGNNFLTRQALEDLIDAL